MATTMFVHRDTHLKKAATALAPALRGHVERLSSQRGPARRQPDHGRERPMFLSRRQQTVHVVEKSYTID